MYEYVTSPDLHHCHVSLTPALPHQVYQRADSPNIGCDPPGMPTADYINRSVTSLTVASDFFFFSDAGLLLSAISTHTPIPISCASQASSSAGDTS